MGARLLKNVTSSREAVDLIAKIILKDTRFHGCKVATSGPIGINDSSVLVIEKDENIITSLHIDNKLTEGRLSVVRRLYTGEETRTALPISDNDIIEMIYAISDKEALFGKGYVYVYKEYNDAYAYGEETVKVFTQKAAATEYLRKRVEEHFEMPFDSVPDNLSYFDDEEDSFSEDYISINSGNGVLYWIVEKKPLLIAA